MEQPISLSWESQIDKYRQRGMIIGDNDVEKLKNISYYRLKEFAAPLATYSNGDISYEGIHFKEVLARYYQDKNLRIFLLHAIEKIEVSVKTRISYILGSNYGAFGYLNFSKWSNKDKYTKFHIEKIQIRIKKNLKKTVEKSQLSELKMKQNHDEDGFPTVWLAIDLLMLGDIVSILGIMSENNIRRVANYYDCTPAELISWMKCLNFVRNVCAHNSNVIDIQIGTKPKTRREWNDLIFMNKEVHKDNEFYKPTNKLAIVLIIIVKLVNQINSKYQWTDIQRSINSLCKKRDDRARLLGFKNLQSAQKVVSSIKKCNQL
ncbi:TPA: Abi family protein [Streptococcus suis]|nr:Abi family protein [Streptococcus suis]HEM3626068.1 Abi family protein [Streptococcus suis]HEM3630399.1 Abi family protein [Streptococcus suis]HEM3643874.1 Abi family protein [Streptococcus suis]HEM3652357.1 Abi family protein [Streptococcus suis]